MTSELKKITVKTDNLDSAAPLYFQYAGQINPQPAYVEIDPRGDSIEISADYSGEIGGGVAGEVWHNLVWQISCPAGILGSVLIEHMNSDEFKKSVLEMCEGYEADYNNQSNLTGRWNSDADDIARELEMELMEMEIAEVYEGDAWIEEDVRYLDENGDPCTWDEAEKAFYGDDPGIEITTENLEKLVADAESYVDDGLQLVTDLEGAFESIIENIN